MHVRVTKNGRVTIPKDLRDRLGISPGQVLDFHEEGGRLVAAKVVTEDPLVAVYGALQLDRPTDAVVDDLRGPSA